MTNYRRADLLGRKHFGEDFGNLYITAGTEGDFDESDIFATASTDPTRTYCIEIKNYEDPLFPRPYSKFTYNGIDYGYQIDFKKIAALLALWKNTGRIPIIYARFQDMTYVWDLRFIDVESRAKWKWVNKDGQNYGKEKEYALQTYLYANEAVWSKPTQKYNS